MTLTSVLAPVDLSDDSKLGARLAAAIAKSDGATLTLFHVDVLPPFSENMAQRVAADVWQGYLDGRLRAAKEQFDQAMAWFDEYERKLVCVAPDSDVAEQIVRFARSREMGLVVMAAHGAQGSARFLLGSVTAGVAAISSCPILVARLRKENALPPDGEFRRALVAVADGNSIDGAIELTCTLTARDAKVELLHVEEQEPRATPALPKSVEEGLAEDRARVRAALERGATRLRFDGRTATVRTERGDAASVLLDRLAGLEYDLVVASARSERRRAGVLGKVAGRLLQHSPVPVALLPVD
jgi:nucleotide-binding universal stress UspA family protein